MNEENKRNSELEITKNNCDVLWEEMQEHGVRLFVDGRPVTPKEAVVKTVRENSPYMADYVIGEDGIITELRFNKVRSH